MREHPSSEPFPSSAAKLPAELEAQVESLAERYLDQLQTGHNPDRAAWVAAHPEIAAALDQQLALVEMMHRLAQRPPPAARSGSG